MAIDPQRRAQLAALITSMNVDRASLVKAGVEQACGHGYNDVQKHAWGLCDCTEEHPCPEWVEEGFLSAEALASGSTPLDPALAAGSPEARREHLQVALGAVSSQMTGLLRGVVSDADEIHSSADFEPGDVFASTKDTEE